MNIKIFNIFLSRESECAWLNRMGSIGYLLTRKSKGFYCFDANPSMKYFYSVEYLDSALETEAVQAYIAQRKSACIDLCLYKRGWAYFVKSGSAIERTVLIARKNSVFYFWRMFYQLFFALWGTVLVGYHLFAVNYLERVAHQGTGLIRFYMSDSEKGILGIISWLVNGILDVFNLYLGIWANAFGASDAIAVIAFALPITVVLILLGGNNLSNYLSCKTEVKNNAK